MKIATGLSTRWMILLTLVALALPHGAAARPPGPGHEPLEHVERVIDRMTLDADTEAAVYGLLDGARAGRRARRDEIRAAHEGMRALLAQTEPDATAVLEQVDHISAAVIADKKASLSVLLKVRAMLPVEQRVELIAAMQPLEGRGKLHAGESAGRSGDRTQ